MSEESDKKQDHGSSTVMVVEPEILVRMVIADYLRECGYKVIEGVTADDVLLVLRAGGVIDIVLAEVQLPGDMDGFSMARLIRAEFPETEVVLAAGAVNAAHKAGELCPEGPAGRYNQPRDVIQRINILREQRRRAKRDELGTAVSASNAPKPTGT